MTTSPSAEDPATLDELRRSVASATGAARAGADVGRHGAGHLARQIVYGVAHGAGEDPKLRALLRTLATESERLSGSATLIRGRLAEAERRAKEASDPGALAHAVRVLEAVHADGVALHAEADALRRRLPRAYGDPLQIDPSWPTT